MLIFPDKSVLPINRYEKLTFNFQSLNHRKRQFLKII